MNEKLYISPGNPLKSIVQISITLLSKWAMMRRGWDEEVGRNRISSRKNDDEGNNVIRWLCWWHNKRLTNWSQIVMLSLNYSSMFAHSYLHRENATLSTAPAFLSPSRFSQTSSPRPPPLSTSSTQCFSAKWTFVRKISTLSIFSTPFSHKIYIYSTSLAGGEEVRKMLKEKTREHTVGSERKSFMSSARKEGEFECEKQHFCAS